MKTLSAVVLLSFLAGCHSHHVRAVTRVSPGPEGSLLVEQCDVQVWTSAQDLLASPPQPRNCVVERIGR